VLRVLGRLQLLCVLALLLAFGVEVVLGRAAAPWELPPFAGFAVVSVAYALLWRCPECDAWFGPGRPRPTCPSCGARLRLYSHRTPPYRTYSYRTPPRRSPARRWAAWMGWLVVGALIAGWVVRPAGLVAPGILAPPPTAAPVPAR